MAAEKAAGLADHFNPSSSASSSSPSTPPASNVTDSSWLIHPSSFKVMASTLEEFLQREPTQRMFVNSQTKPPAPASPSSSSSPPSSASPSSPNLAQLLIGFFHFYGYTFQAETMAVCIRSGGIVPKPDLVRELRRSNPKARIDLILSDPFDPSDNVARGITTQVWQRIRAAMRRAYAGLIATGRYEAILVRDTRGAKSQRKRNRKERREKMAKQQAQPTQQQTQHAQSHQHQSQPKPQPKPKPQPQSQHPPAPQSSGRHSSPPSRSHSPSTHPKKSRSFKQQQQIQAAQNNNTGH